MSSFETSCIVFGAVFAGAILGMFLRRILPAQHLGDETRDAVKLGMGLIATVSGMVLGLLVASAKSSFDSQKSELTQLAGNASLLDRTLAMYGPDSREARKELGQALTELLSLCSQDDRSIQGRTPGGHEGLYEKIHALVPKTELQKSLQSTAIKTLSDMGQSRWMLYAQNSSSIPTPLLVVMVSWLSLLFVSFSLFSKPNGTVVVSLVISALSIAGAIFLILELDRPFDGIIRIPGDSIRHALERIGQ